MDYAKLVTEKVNASTENIDLCSSREIVELINREGSKSGEGGGEGAAFHSRGG